MPPETTRKVALRGEVDGRLATASHRRAFGPPSPTRVSPPRGSSRQLRQPPAAAETVAPTFTVTGAEIAVRAASAASASCSCVTFGSVRPTGSLTGAPRSSEARADTIVADASARSRRRPALAGCGRSGGRVASPRRPRDGRPRPRPRRRRTGPPTGTPGRAVPRRCRRDASGRASGRGAERTRPRPPAALRTAPASPGVRPAGMRCTRSVRPPATNWTGVRWSLSKRRSSASVAPAIQPTDVEAGDRGPRGRRSGDPAKSTAARKADRATRPTARTVLRTASRGDRRRRATPDAGRAGRHDLEM